MDPMKLIAALMCAIPWGAILINMVSVEAGVVGLVVQLVAAGVLFHLS